MYKDVPCAKILFCAPAVSLVATKPVAADVCGRVAANFFTAATIQTIGPNVERDDRYSSGAMRAPARCAWAVDSTTVAAAFHRVLEALQAQNDGFGRPRGHVNGNVAGPEGGRHG
jgi:hypothetical protein